MAALTCLRSVETNLTLTCPSPKSFVCNLPDSGRHVTSVFQGLSLSLRRRVGENPGNEVASTVFSLHFEVCIVTEMSIHNASFAAGQSHGTNMPRWRVRHSLRRYKELLLFKMDTALSYLIPVRILLASLLANYTTWQTSNNGPIEVPQYRKVLQKSKITFHRSQKEANRKQLIACYSSCIHV